MNLIEYFEKEVDSIEHLYRQHVISRDDYYCFLRDIPLDKKFHDLSNFEAMYVIGMINDSIHRKEENK